jgi:hypothetical protein
MELFLSSTPCLDCSKFIFTATRLILQWKNVQDNTSGGHRVIIHQFLKELMNVSDDSI